MFILHPPAFLSSSSSSSSRARQQKATQDRKESFKACSTASRSVRSVVEGALFCLGALPKLSVEKVAF